MVGNINREAVAFATLVPGVGYLAGCAVWLNKSIGLQEFFKNAKKPSYAITEESTYFALDVATMVPACYAAYIVYDNGGFKHDDTKMACTAFAVLNATALFAVPVWKSKSWKKIFWVTSVINGLQFATLLTFFAVDKKAGLLFLPSVLYGHHLAVSLMGMVDLNA